MTRCIVHTFTNSKRAFPQRPLDRNPHQVVPPTCWVPRLRGAASPKRGLSRFGVTVTTPWPPRAAVEAAAFFDLDRTLLAGGSGPVFSEAHARPPGSIAPVDPGRADCCTGCSTASARRCRRWPWPARPPRLAKGRSRRRVQAAAERRPTCWSAMIQPFAGAVIDEHRAAGRRLVLATTTPVRPGQAAGRAARLRRRDRHPLRRQRRRHLRRHASTGRSCGRRQARRPCGSGPTRHDVDLRHELRLLRQRLRHAAAVAPSAIRCVGQPRSADAARWPLARRWPIAPPRRAAGRAQAARSSTSSRSSWPLAVRPAATVPLRPLRHRRRRAHPRGGAGDPRRQPPQLLRRRRRWRCVIARSGRTVRFLGKKEVFDVPVIGQLAKAMGGIRVERGTRHRTSRCRPRPRRSRPARWWRSCRRARSRAGRGVLRPGAQGPLGRGPAGGHDQGAGRSRSGCGAPRRCGPARPACPNMLQRRRPAAGAVAGRATGRAEVPQPRRRHQADHEGHRRPAPARGAPAPRTDGRGAAPHLPAGVQGRPARGEPPAGRAPTERCVRPCTAERTAATPDALPSGASRSQPKRSGGWRRRSVADAAVDHLPDEVGVAVVAGVLLDHVDHDPAQDSRARPGGCRSRRATRPPPRWRGPDRTRPATSRDRLSSRRRPPARSRRPGASSS